jgi:hypothetical protein
VTTTNQLLVDNVLALRRALLVVVQLVRLRRQRDVGVGLGGLGLQGGQLRRRGAPDDDAPGMGHRRAHILPDPAAPGGGGAGLGALVGCALHLHGLLITLASFDWMMNRFFIFVNITFVAFLH